MREFTEASKKSPPGVRCGYPMHFSLKMKAMRMLKFTGFLKLELIAQGVP